MGLSLPPYVYMYEKFSSLVAVKLNSVAPICVRPLQSFLTLKALGAIKKTYRLRSFFPNAKCGSQNPSSFF